MISDTVPTTQSAWDRWFDRDDMMYGMSRAARSRNVGAVF